MLPVELLVYSTSMVIMSSVVIGVNPMFDILTLLAVWAFSWLVIFGIPLMFLCLFHLCGGPRMAHPIAVPFYHPLYHPAPVYSAEREFGLLP
jgi:hypothetical protein